MSASKYSAGMVKTVIGEVLPSRTNRIVVLRRMTVVARGGY